jgi:hypothetical protein
MNSNKYGKLQLQINEQRLELERDTFFKILEAFVAIR